MSITEAIATVNLALQEFKSMCLLADFFLTWVDFIDVTRDYEMHSHF